MDGLLSLFCQCLHVMIFTNYKTLFFFISILDIRIAMFHYFTSCILQCNAPGCKFEARMKVVKAHKKSSIPMLNSKFYLPSLIALLDHLILFRLLFLSLPPHSAMLLVVNSKPTWRWWKHTSRCSIPTLNSKFYLSILFRLLFLSLPPHSATLLVVNLKPTWRWWRHTRRCNIPTLNTKSDG